MKKAGFSRRWFIKAAGMTMAGMVGLSVVGCDTEPEIETISEATTILPQPVQYPAVPGTPMHPPPDGELVFFTPHEALTVEAFTARLLPGTPDDPGAREAGVVFYIDRQMAYEGGFAEPTYFQPPFADTYSDDEPAQDDARTNFKVIWISEDDIDRYGFQSMLTPREVMRLGLAAIDRYANQQFDEDFIDLDEENQDSIVQAMLDGEATGFEPLTPTTFFHIMRRYTAEGMFSDPVYGGNRNYAGWKLIGYPGAQRAYLPHEIREEGSGLKREIWSIANMPAFNPGQNVGRGEINPVSGSEEFTGEHREKRER